MAFASATDLPRIRSPRLPALRGETRTYLAVALTMPYFLFMRRSLLPPCPRKVRVSANSPSLWPTMLSVT